MMLICEVGFPEVGIFGRQDKYFYSRATNSTVRKALRRAWIAKPDKCEYFLRTLFGHASAPNCIWEASIRWFNQHVILGEDIIFDLQENNGRISIYDVLWDIVDKYIQSKIAIDDQRYGSRVDGEIVLTIAITTSYTVLWR